MDLLAIVSSYFPSLSKSEQKVAQLILSNPDEIEDLSINQLAMMAGVGESTIVRFARKIGYAGYQDLKLALTKYQATAEKRIDSKENKDDDIVFEQYVDSLKETKSFLESNKIDRAVQFMNEARRIFIFAVGESGFIGMELSNRLKRLGKNVEFVQDGQLQSIYATTMDKKDVAFSISTSGNTNEVIINMSLAKSNGCKVIALTNYLGSKIAEESDLSLIASSKEFHSDAGSFASSINQLFIIDIVIRELVKQDPEKFHKLRMKRNQALVDHL